MAHPVDLPGYRFDPVKNRYFPLPPLHQRSRERDQSSAETSSTSSHQVEAQQDTRHAHAQRRRDVLPGLIHEREISSQGHGRHAPSAGCNSRAFQGKYLELSTSQFRVWKYGETVGFSDGGLEHLCMKVETADGDDAVVDVLILGGTDRQLRVVQAVDWTSETAEESQSYPTEQCLPPHSANLWTGEEEKGAAPVIWPSRNSLHFRSQISSVKRLNNWSESDSLKDGSCLQQSLIVTTVGDGANGGGLHLVRLKAEDSVRTPGHCPLSFREVININNRASVWTSESDPRGRRASFGITAGAMILDLETCQASALCYHSSDCFAQQFDSSGNVVFCGFRNGVISTIDLRRPKGGGPPHNCWCTPSGKSGGDQFDKRRSSSQGTRKFKWSERRQRHSTSKSRTSGRTLAYSPEGNNRAVKNPINEFYCSHHPIMQMKSAICSLKLRRSDENYLLASSLNGDIQEWDRRLVGRGPVRSYYGHCNSHTTLQLGMDPTERLLVSGGEDCAVRIWSLESGQLLKVHRGLPFPVTTVSWPTALRVSDSQRWGGFCEEGPAVLNDCPATLWMGCFSGLLHGRFSVR